MAKKNLSLFLPLIVIMTFSVLTLYVANRLDLIPWILLESVTIYILLLSFNQQIRSALWILYICILGLQIVSIYSSGYYIIPLTISNYKEAAALGSNTLIFLSSLWIVFFLSSFIILHVKNNYFFPGFKRVLICILCVVILACPTPLNIFAQTLFSYYKQISYVPSYNYPTLSKHYLKVNIWSGDAPAKISTENVRNIIVIFTEGMSAGIIDDVNQKNINITPNLNKLYSESAVFYNYFNHTAATFRGLRGQLTSAYQYKDGINDNQDGFAQISNEKVLSDYSNRLVSLPEILNKHGYKTLFLSSTDKNSTLNTMLKSMPFTHVYGMGDFEGYQDDRMTDKQTFSALIKLLAEQQDQPFFIGVYPSGTHHGRDSPDLKYKDGKNSYYNKFYNYDAQLGEFIKYFNSSKFAKDTTLIITADHSTFPTPEFKNSFGISANYFVDQIPLIIHGSGIHPQKIDAHANNSLSLAPTILQLLNINNEPNFFLGCSLFDKHCKSRFSNISAVGDVYYHTAPGVFPAYNVEEIPTSLDIKEFYNISG